MGNYGLLIKAQDESASSNISFYGGKRDDASIKPQFTVTYFDGPTAPSAVSVSKQYLKNGENVQISWSGITSRALDYVQYRAVMVNASTGEVIKEMVPYSAASKLGTTSSGTKTITGSMGWEVGSYKIYVRGVDKFNIEGEEKEVEVVIDRIKPVVGNATMTPSSGPTSYSNTLPTVTWNVTENNLLCIQLSINSGAYFSIGTSASGSKQITGIVSGQSNSLRLRAVDKAGNTSTVVSFTHYYDNSLPAISNLTTIPETNETEYSNNTNPTIEYNISDSTLDSVQCFVGDEEIEGIDNNSNGSITGIEFAQGENVIKLVATDKAGNEATKEIKYYLDTVNPQRGSVTVNPTTSSSSYRSALPIITWSGFSDDFLKEVQISINGGEYKTLGLKAYCAAQLEASDFTETGAYSIKVRAIDVAGNTSDEWSGTYYYKETVSDVNQYVPVDVYAVERLNGSTLIRFSNEKGEYPEDIGYEIHRGTDPLFVPDSTTLVEVTGKECEVEITNEKGITYYYKVRAITLDGEIEYSSFSDEIASTTLTDDEIDARCGTKDIHSYSSIGTPNGSISFELSKGNMMYEQSDIALPASQIPINISRAYNSNSQVITGFGYGWSSTYDAYISAAGSSDDVIYQDGTKAVYVFEMVDNEYVCSENPDIKFERGIETISRTIKSGDLERTISVKSRYRITTKENEVLYFDSLGRLNLVEEANGTFVYICYDRKGHIEYIETSSGQKVEYVYGNGSENKEYITEIRVVDGSYYSYEYKNDRIIKVTHHGNNGGAIEYCYAYNEEGNISTITDAKGNDYSIEYKDGMINKVIYPDGDSCSFMKAGTASIVKGIRSNGVEYYNEYYSFTTNGKVSYSIDRNGNSTNYSYSGELLTNTSESIYKYSIVDGVVKSVNAKKTDDVVYDNNKNIVSSTDNEGNVTTYTYENTEENLKNFPTSMLVKDALETIIAQEIYEYDNLGNVIRIEDHISNTVSTYAYDENGNVTKSVDTLVAKNENSSEISDSDIENGLKQYQDDSEYDKDGNIVIGEMNSGTVNEQTNAVYDGVGRLISDVNEKGVKTEYTYDEFGRVIETKETSKGKVSVTKNEYNANGALIKEIDKVGRITTFEYDEMNRPVKQTITADGETKILTMSYSYELLSINDGKGTGQTNVNTSVVTTRNTDGEIVEKVYKNSSGQIVRELSNGLYVDYTYDQQNRVFTTYTGGINEDDVLNIVEGKLAISIYDANGNLTDTIINPEYSDGSFKIGEESIVTSNVYDSAGMLIKTIDAKGNETEYEYDEQGRITKVKLSDGTGTSNETHYTYDIENKNEEGKLVSTSETVKDAFGRVSETVSNGADQVLCVTDKNDGNNLVTSYEYDASGNKSKDIYNDGSYIVYEYNEFDYMTKSITYDKTGTAEKTTEYCYDDEYNIIKTIDSKANENGYTPYRYTIYRYDALGRNTGVAEINASSEPSESQIEAALITYVYDIDDNVTKIYYPNTSADELKGVEFDYNKDKWITQINGIVGSEEQSYVIRKYEYYTDGKLKSIKDYTDFLNEGTAYIERNYEYDVFDRVTSMKYFNSSDVDKILEQYEYTYDKNSNILSERTVLSYENRLKDEERRYTYDELDRLVKTEIVNNLTYKTSEITYKFDKVGNRTEMTEDGVTTVYTYNDLDQLIKSVETNGSSAYTTTYEYDLKGNQVKVTDAKTGTITENTYDVNNQLINVKIIENGEVIKAQENEYNGAGQRISKTEDGVKTCYFYEGALLLYTTDVDGNKTSQNVYGVENNIIASIRYEKTDEDSKEQHAYMYSKDVKGSTIVITGEKGNCVISYDYTDYGETTKNCNNDFYNEICYTGGIYDETTGLYYLNARYYNPADGVFLSQDTYRGETDDYVTWNLYAYCAGNPICYVDPSGHVIETGFDIASMGYSGYQFIKEPSLENGVYLAWDVGATVAPYVPGSYTARGVKAVKAAKDSGKIKKAVKTVKSAGKKVATKVKARERKLSRVPNLLVRR